MSNKCPEPPTDLVNGRYYRIWSLGGQGFLNLIPKDGAPKDGKQKEGPKMKKDADFSGTGKSEENTSE